MAATACASRFLRHIKPDYLERIESAPSEDELLSLLGRQYGFELSGLKTALKEFAAHAPGFDARRTFARLASWLRCSPLTADVQPLPTGRSGCAAFPRWLIRVLLAAALLGLPLESDSAAGTLNFHLLVGHNNASSVHKTICLLAYFHYYVSVDDSHRDDDQVVEFVRAVQSPAERPSEAALRALRVDAERVLVHGGSMESAMAEGGGGYFVDFANECLHIHRVIPSSTQEEILFSMAPEAYVGLLVAGIMEHNEAILITGLRRFSTYSGYLLSFRFAGLHSPYPSPCFAVVAIDASVGNNFTAWHLRRDTNKAYIGFRAAVERHGATARISTGSWGCGAFGGCAPLKFVQQVCAAALAGVPLLAYSAFFNDDLLHSYRALLAAMAALPSVWHIIQLCESPDASRADFAAWFIEAARRY